MNIFKRKVYITIYGEEKGEETFAGIVIDFWFWQNKSDVITQTVKDYSIKNKPDIIKNIKVF